MVGNMILSMLIPPCLALVLILMLLILLLLILLEPCCQRVHVYGLLVDPLATVVGFLLAVVMVDKVLEEVAVE